MADYTVNATTGARISEEMEQRLSLLLQALSAKRCRLTFQSEDCPSDFCYWTDIKNTVTEFVLKGGFVIKGVDVMDMLTQDAVVALNQGRKAIIDYFEDRMKGEQNG